MTAGTFDWRGLDPTAVPRRERAAPRPFDLAQCLAEFSKAVDLVGLWKHRSPDEPMTPAEAHFWLEAALNLLRFHPAVGDAERRRVVERLRATTFDGRVDPVVLRERAGPSGCPAVAEVLVPPLQYLLSPEQMVVVSERVKELTALAARSAVKK